jgi:hypothetical protein
MTAKSKTTDKTPDLTTPIHQMTNFWRTEMDRLAEASEEALARTTRANQEWLKESQRLFEAQTQFMLDAQSQFASQIERMFQTAKKVAEA